MKSKIFSYFTAGFVGLSIVSAPAAASDCDPFWSTIGIDSIDGKIDSFIRFDDGSGSALYIGGNFTMINGQSFKGVARWDGSTLSPVGDGFENTSQAAIVADFEVYDDGTGPALYASGLFEQSGAESLGNLARWDGSSWVDVGSGTTTGVVWDMVVFDDGRGPALYIGGTFPSAGGVSGTSRLARWDGSVWEALGQGVSDPDTTAQVFALTVFDDGTGPALYAGGRFTLAGPVQVNRVAKWDGSTWSSLASGIDGDVVQALAVHDDGTGPALYVGGSFDAADGIPADGIARWNGSEWSDVGGGIAGNVWSFATLNDGNEPELFVGGSFSQPQGAPGNRIARWTGNEWLPLGSGASSLVSALYIDPLVESGTRALHVGGSFTTAGGLDANGVARYVMPRPTWARRGQGTNAVVRTIMEADLGNGPEVFIGGDFTEIAGQLAPRIARVVGNKVFSLGSGAGDNASVYAIAQHDDGSGPAIYMGGSFTVSNGGPGKHIAKWNGSSWEPLAGGLNGPVYALLSADFGNGPILFAAGDFTQADGVTANNIARWDGTSWSPVPGFGVNGPVYALIRLGNSMIAAGDFTQAGTVPASRIARLTGLSWSALGSGVDAPVRSMAIFPTGQGPSLFVAGEFITAGGAVVDRIARWNGSIWSEVGPGFADGTVYGITAIDLDTDFGTGQPLTPIAMGSFTESNGRQVNGIARWDGSSWQPFGGPNGVGVNGTVYSAVDFDEPGRMFVGGSFTEAGGATASRLAIWSTCVEQAAACPADVNFDGFINLADLNIVLANFGQQTGDGDTNDDGQVNLADLNAVLAAFGTECP